MYFMVLEQFGNKPNVFVEYAKTTQFVFFYVS